MDLERRRGCVYYQWIILKAACSSKFLRSTFLFVTLPVLLVYYDEQFSDRQLSSMVGPIQTALSFGGGENLIHHRVNVLLGDKSLVAHAIGK